MLIISDDKMQWSQDDEMHIIKPEYVHKKTGINLHKVLKPDLIDDTQRRAGIFLTQIADDIRTYIFNANVDNEYQKHLMNYDEWVRDNILLPAQLEQVTYTLTSGRGYLYSGQNFKDGKQMDRDQIIKASMSPQAIAALNKTIPHIGKCLVYRGAFSRF